ncbi:MAG: lipoyl(octanoyl) transferase LipB [Betaproteobacteria bacterium]
MQVRWLGRQPYAGMEARMRSFTEGRVPDTPDELWIVEHDPVFTQGIGGRAEHVLMPGDIPVVRTQRGGQVTFHGPGQVVAYPLVDLRRLGIFVKEYVYRLEAAVLQVLDAYGVTGHRIRTAPGIYVRLADPFDHAPLPLVDPGAHPFEGLGKIAALGVKVTRHCAYHGLAVNVDMELEPFGRINPCGYAGLRTVDLRSLGVSARPSEVSLRLAQRLETLLSA